MSVPLEPRRCHSDLSHPQAREPEAPGGLPHRSEFACGAAHSKKQPCHFSLPPFVLLGHTHTHTCSRYACSQCPLVLCIPVSLSCVSSGSDFMCCFRVCAYGLCLRAAALYLVSLAWHSRWQVFCQCLQDVLGDFLLVVCRFVFTLKSQFCCSIC